MSPTPQRITLISSASATAVPLVVGDNDRAAGKFIKNYTGDTPSRIQPRTCDNALYPSPIWRGYGQPYRSWTTDYGFDTAAKAFTFSETHADNIPGTGQIKIESDGGIVFFDYILETARLVERNGETAVFAYKVLLLGPGRTTINKV